MRHVWGSVTLLGVLFSVGWLVPHGLLLAQSADELEAQIRDRNEKIQELEKEIAQSTKMTRLLDKKCCLRRRWDLNPHALAGPAFRERYLAIRNTPPIFDYTTSTKMPLDLRAFLL